MKKLFALAICASVFWSCQKQDDETNPDSTPEEPAVIYVSPLIEGSKATLEYGKMKMVIDGLEGSKITSLSYEGNEFLSLDDVDASNWGSTFWIAPQSIWNWPPPVAFDQSPYTLTSDSLHAYFQGLTDNDYTDCAIKKTFTLNGYKGEFDITYSIQNKGTETTDVAPWEITRVPTGGITVFPKGEIEKFDNEFTIVDTLEALWFDYDNATITGNSKLFANSSEGWIAHIDDNYVLLKKFYNITAEEEAPGEAEIEIYINKGKYVEVEQQGEYKSVAAGDSYDWDVKWKIVEIPASIERNKISTELLSFIKESL